MTAENIIPSADLIDLFPGIDESLPLEIPSLSLGQRSGQMPVYLPYEHAVVAGIVRLLQPRRLLEFGTAQGKTTYILAANSPEDAEVLTLDIAAEEPSDYTLKCLNGDDALGRAFAGSVHADKITQIFRKTADGCPEALEGRDAAFDYLHVDADHSYSGVKADSRLALDLAGPEAILVWHDFYMFPDYIAQGPERRGVFPYLNELAGTGEIALRHILGTYFVVGCKAWAHDLPGKVFQPGEFRGPFGERIVRLGG
ncbi:MAG: class I SAM-dependent methyltransferase [Magnetovibrionaceae bacterium]